MGKDIAKEKALAKEIRAEGEEMAKKIGCTRATYSAIEAGNRDGRRTFWKDLQRAFNISDEDMWALMKNE